MTDDDGNLPYGDALSRPFWEAAARHELVVQRCRRCGHAQLYPRPFCLRCFADEVHWQPASGTGVVYSMTTVHMQFMPDLQPPYVAAVVELDEGPRLTTVLVGDGARIGARVRVRWRPRPELPDFPDFEPVEDENEET